MMTSGALGVDPVVTSPALANTVSPELATATNVAERVVDEVKAYFHNHHFNLLQFAHEVLSRQGYGHCVDEVIAAAEKLAAHLEAKVEAELKKL